MYLAKNGVRGSQMKGEEREPGAGKNTHEQSNILAFGQSCKTPKYFLHLGSRFERVDQCPGFSQPYLLSIDSLVTFSALSGPQSLFKILTLLSGDTERFGRESM